MPRDGSNIYSQPDPDVVADTTIESAKYNNFTNDIAQDLNLPRPIVAGGTGATSAAGAITNLGGEKALQVVTNYDSFLFVSGSFYSTAGATSAPTGNAFSGIVYTTDSNNMVVMATDSTTGLTYTRRKTAGTWGAWADINAAMDAAKVDRAGDGMTGSLAFDMPDPVIYFNKASGAHSNMLDGRTAGSQRWLLRLGNDNAEGGSNAGSNFDLLRYSDAGSYIATALSVSRANGELGVVGNITTSANVTVGNSSSGGTYFFGSSGVKYLQYDGSKFLLLGGDFQTDSFVYSIGYRCRSGVTGSFGANAFNIFHGTGQQLYIDNTNVGTFAYTSDYRTKKDVADLSGTWDAVKALRPIKYTHKDFTPPSEKNASEPFMKGDDVEHWGFFAHELQEALVKSASSGVKDSPDTIQSPNPWTIIAALTKALQEAMMRIEALEAR